MPITIERLAVDFPDHAAFFHRGHRRAAQQQSLGVLRVREAILVSRAVDIGAQRRQPLGPDRGNVRPMGGADAGNLFGSSPFDESILTWQAQRTGPCIVVASASGIGGAAGNNWGGAPVHPAGEVAGGVATDEDGDGIASVYDPADAIAGTAKILLANGVLSNVSAAIFAYNHLES